MEHKSQEQIHRDTAPIKAATRLGPCRHVFVPLQLLTQLQTSQSSENRLIAIPQALNNEKLFWLDRGITLQAFRKCFNSNSRSMSELFTIKSQSWRLMCSPHTLWFVKRLREKEVPFVCPSYWQLRKIHFKVLRWVYWLAINANKAEVSLPCAALVIFICSSISP